MAMTLTEAWFELEGIDDNPVLAVEAEIAKEREERIEDSIELQHKQEGVTKAVLEKGVTEFTESDEQKPVEPIKEELDERLFANFEESCDDELDEGLFGDIGDEENPVEEIDPKKPFNADDYQTEKEARMAFEIYMNKKFGNKMTERCKPWKDDSKQYKLTTFETNTDGFGCNVKAIYNLPNLCAN